MAKKSVDLETKAKAFAKKEIAKAKAKLAIAEKKVIVYAKKNPKRALMIAGAVGAAVGAGIAIALSKMKKK